MTDLLVTALGVSASTGLVVLLLLLLSPLLNRRYASKWKYLIWILLAARLLLLIDAGDVLEAADDVFSRKEEPAAQAEPEGTGIEAERPAPRRIMLEIPARMTSPLSGQDKKGMTPLEVSAFVWGAGSLLFIAVHMAGYLHYKRRVLRDGTKVKEAALWQQMLTLKREMGIRRTVFVIEFPEAESPMLLGFFRQILVLPDREYSREEMFFILKHELVHVKRGDVYWKLLLVAANGVHWFNPLVWIMRKEAAVDMELSCDERVTKGADPATKKAYTETLLSTLHKGRGRRIVLSTGFYGGKQIMKKRFRNILRKTGKKNGLPVLLSAAVLTICMGTLVGCSVAQENRPMSDEERISQTAGRRASDSERMELVVWGEQSQDENASENISSEESAAEDVVTLTLMKNGIIEEKRAVLTVEQGEFSFYLPEGEWQKEAAAMWHAMANEDVQLWAAGFEKDYPIGQILESDHYVPDETGGMTKEEDGLYYRARLYEERDKIWLVAYCYPVEEAGSWSSQMAVIADTFAVISENSELVLGYITGFDGDTVTIDLQDWVVPGTLDWKPEYDLDVGFEIVDLEGEDAVYPISGDCRYFILEDHQGECVEVDAAAFEEYWRETDFPIFWSVELENKEAVSFAEWYRP